MEQIYSQFPKWEKPMSKNCNDLTGKVFGKLTVLYRYYQNNKNGGSQWVCQCECGNIKIILGASLTRNDRPTRSCGCQTYENASKANINDLTGHRFGKLVVMEDTKIRKNHRVVWRCKCDCGQIVERVSDSLIQGDTKSCGCCNTSLGEIKIEELLREHNIIFQKQKTYEDLVGKNNIPYRFDFYLPEYNRLIEFDGIQHFQERNFFSDTFEEICIRDKIKNKYCKNKGIPLVRIPYWKISDLTIKDLLERKYEVEI